MKQTVFVATPVNGALLLEQSAVVMMAIIVRMARFAVQGVAVVAKARHAATMVKSNIAYRMITHVVIRV